MKKQYISAEDIQSLFYTPQKKKRQLFSWQVMSAILLIVFAIFFAVNAPAALQQIRFWWQHDIQQAVSTKPETVPFLPNVATTPTPQNTMPADVAAMKDNSIYIPKIKVQAPVIWDVTAGSDVNTDMLRALEKGVARYPQTALPDQIGNVFLTGHSSNYWWEKGSYKTVFALLDRLVVGDMIYVKYNGVLYTYKVTSQKVVKPTETSVLNPTKDPTLSLMTCTPTGTSLLRRIVTASLISPMENLKQQPTKPAADALQNIR